MRKILYGLIRHLWMLYNKCLFKKAKVVYGSKFCVFNSIYLKNGGQISIGDDFLFTSGGGYNPLCRNIKGAVVATDGAVVTIGNHVHISSACIWARESITIGNDVKIGGDTLIIDSDAHSLDYHDRRIGFDDLDVRNAESAGIVIGNDVMIGTRCIILKGVHIGDRCVIGAGSIVTKSIPADSIAAGNPCKVLRSLI